MRRRPRSRSRASRKRYRLGQNLGGYTTLRETLAARRRTARGGRATASSGRCATSASRCRRRGARRDRAERRRQDDAPQDSLADHAAHLRRLADARARGRAARRRHGLPSRADRAREHLPQRRDPRHVAAGRRPALRRDRRLLGARAVPRHAAQALLVGDVPPARVRGRRARRAGDRDRRRGARRRRRAVPREVPREDVGVRARGPDRRLRQPRPRLDHPALPARDLARPRAHPGRRAERGDRPAVRPRGGRRRPARRLHARPDPARAGARRGGRGRGRPAAGPPRARPVR